MTWRHLPTWLVVATPVRPGLRVHVRAPGVVAVRHLWGRGVRRWILVVRVRSRARRCDGRIYRYIAVRLLLVGLMVASIWQRHGRTCWCLRHTSAAGAVTASWMIRPLKMLGEGARARRAWVGVDAVVRRRGRGRGGVVVARPHFLLRVGRSRCLIYG